jgi:hypothetical protein
MIDEFSGLLKKIKNTNKEIHIELGNQAPIIDSLDTRAEQTKIKIQSTTNKLDLYLQKSSNCCLFSFIFLEILVIVMLLIA